MALPADFRGSARNMTIAGLALKTGEVRLLNGHNLFQGAQTPDKGDVGLLARTSV